MDNARKEKLFQIVATTFEIPLKSVSEDLAAGSIPQWIRWDTWD